MYQASLIWQRYDGKCAGIQHLIFWKVVLVIRREIGPALNDMKGAARLYQAGARAFAMDNSFAGAEPVRTAFGRDLMITKAVKMLNLTFDHIGECHKAPVRMFVQVRQERDVFLITNWIAM